MVKKILTNDAFEIAEKKQGLKGIETVSFKVTKPPIKEKITGNKFTNE